MNNNIVFTVQLESEDFKEYLDHMNLYISQYDGGSSYIKFNDAREFCLNSYRFIMIFSSREEEHGESKDNSQNSSCALLKVSLKLYIFHY